MVVVVIEYLYPPDVGWASTIEEFNPQYSDLEKNNSEGNGFNEIG